jgi:LuxR family transcriptional regulator, maltose regulon positive regulatory protein
MTPIVQGDTLVYQQGRHEQTLAVGTAAWYSWLETASTFAFVSGSGTFTARREQSGHKRGGWYWKAYRKQHGKLSSRYLGKSKTLTLAHLQAAAQALADAPGRITQAGDADSAIPFAPPASDLLNPLLVTKLHPPLPRAHLVRRSHLLERLQQGMAGPLTLVSAPAGFGKTTLLAQWRASSRMPVAWLSLEPQDNEPVRFLSYLIAALQTLDPRTGTVAFTLLQTPQPAAPETVLTLLTNDVVSREPDEGDFALVLDDYHVIEASPIHHALLFLLEHLPPRMHLILLTRADPPLPLSRLRARGQLTELRAAELRFATHEVSAFLRTVMGLDLSPEVMATLESRTEGWIAGLQFAALSLRGRTDVSAYLAAFTGSHRFVLDYLSEEVFAQQPTSVRAFLLHTAVLDRLSAPLCEAVTGQADSQAMLEAFEDANLFVVALDDERRWYRYHHLFAEVLYSQLQQAEPDLVSELHRRASAWYEQYGSAAEAVQHALAAPDVELAARLIEQYALPVALRGQVHLVLGWLNTLPEALKHSHVRLCLYDALMLMFTQQLDAAEARVALAEQSIQAAMPADQARVILGWAAGIRANLARFSGDLARCVTLSHQTLELVPETEVMMRAAAALGPAQTFLVSGDVTAASQRMIAATAAPLRATGDVFALLTSITFLARLHILQGRLREAAATYEQVLHLVPEQEVLRFLVGSAAYYFGQGDLLREWNDLDAAERFLAQGMELVRGTLTVDALVVTLGYTALARLKQARGEYNAALATLDALARLSHERHYVLHLLAYQAAVRAQLELAQGKRASAIHWLGKSGLSTADADLSYLREREYLTLVRVRIEEGRADPAGTFLQDAQGLLARLQTTAEAKARMGSVLEILLLRALAFDAQGNRTQALASLERALLLAEPEGYIRLFVDEGEAMAALLRQAHAHGIAPGYVATLLSSFGEQALAAPSRAFPPVEPLTERELAVFRLLVAGLSNAAIAQELVITVGTVKRHVNSIYTKLGVNSRTQAVAHGHTLHVL